MMRDSTRVRKGVYAAGPVNRRRTTGALRTYGTDCGLQGRGSGDRYERRVAGADFGPRLPTSSGRGQEPQAAGTDLGAWPWASAGMRSPASTGTGRRFSAGGSGQVARSV